MDQQRLNYLHQAYLDGTLTATEQEEWSNYFQQAEQEAPIKNLMDQTWHNILPEERIVLTQAQSDRIFNEIIGEPQVSKIRLWPRIAIAAAVATMIFGAGLFYYNNLKKADTTITVSKNDVAPGKQGATLTLASGEKIRLSDAGNGELAKQAGVVISKSPDGKLVYEIKNKGEEGAINTLSTAKGETYQVRLPDGSLVWLNAASSLTYSATLNERGVRRVKLEGEGYFEIAKDKAHLFIVESKGQRVEVLGTHFNVSAYSEETAIKTTLLEGSVRLNESKVLRPGEQATLSRTGKIDIAVVDTDDAVAWKNGKFVFDYENLESVMRKLARWYDVEVVYQTEVSKKTFSGTVGRFDNISMILEKITYTNNVHFKIEGRRIMVID